MLGAGPSTWDHWITLSPVQPCTVVKFAHTLPLGQMIKSKCPRTCWCFLIYWIHFFHLIWIRLCNPLFWADFREILESRDFCRHPNKEDSGGWRKKLNFSFVQVEDSSLICLPWAIACLSQTMIQSQTGSLAWTLTLILHYKTGAFKVTRLAKKSTYSLQPGWTLFDPFNFKKQK